LSLKLSLPASRIALPRGPITVPNASAEGSGLFRRHASPEAVGVFERARLS
jgi:hypothetical protein